MSNKNIQANFLVYKHTSPSGKSYIGITSNLKRRNKAHKHKSSGCTAFSSAIKKYGWNNISHTILATGLTLQAANHFEQFYIKHFDSLSPNGYNLKTGGDVIRFCEDTLQKLRNAKGGEKNYWFGKNLSPETKQKMSEAAKGRRHTTDSKQKMSDSRKGEYNHFFGKTHTPDTLEKISGENSPLFGIFGKDNPKSKKYLVITPKGEPIIIVGLADFCRKNNLSDSGMINVSKIECIHHKKHYCEQYEEGKYSQKELEDMGISWAYKMSGFNKWITGSEHKLSKDYKITTPEGIVLIIKCLSKFCIENNLSRSGMTRIATGRYKNYKGWICEYYNEENNIITKEAA